MCPKWLDRKLASDFSGAKHGGDQANASDIVPNVYEGEHGLVIVPPVSCAYFDVCNSQKIFFGL